MKLIEIVKILKNKLVGSKVNQQRINEIESNTIALKEARKSDVNRWQKNEELFTNWNERTAIMADFIPSDANVIEFGAGVMHMKSILPKTVTYTPSDIVKRYEETVVCDLNEPITVNLKQFDTAVFSGVLEYVYNIENVIDQLSNASINHIICSYCCSDIITLSREKNGWLSDYTKSELEAIFSGFGYTVKNYQLWNNQSIFNLVREQ
ncbi:Protein of unknown function [Flavobacterium indicum GPTSA100-9 = DSM 17447]|uniref:Methyltransferase type 11 domain-containing protein n=1 Tax=Flavobacterium indicum (strain DSM 17447 / CIP 109464 / GPTSA100-9) TaxID=1094466 RepID=H8XT65_FLAIG|nr:hypothetical protein [Flavobacterium indicum]CCG52662.1 Protein of unknown function [Flavobacterium indicum GPTSA100-9 = DSM 17447]